MWSSFGDMTLFIFHILHVFWAKNIPQNYDYAYFGKVSAAVQPVEEEECVRYVWRHNCIYILKY